MAYTALGIESNQFGITDLTQFTIIGISIISAFGIVRVFSNKRKEYGYSEREVAYHYLESAIYEYENGPNYEKILTYLGDFKDYCGSSNRIVLPPERQEELMSYINHLEDSGEKEYKNAIDSSFEQNLRIIAEDVFYMRSRALTLPEQEDEEEDVDGPSAPRILIETLLESITLNRLMFISGISIVAVAIIGYHLGGPQVAALILMSFPILQALISFFDENKTD
ncbi:hypothetical protein ACFQDG_18230 [Natronoarchaeum mannanilyticum]|uniref:hypothetical protein n=1 Tax=Natronoarchaeum mannanilyticum TaxID=926360 RepID=UPI0031DD8F6A